MYSDSELEAAVAAGALSQEAAEAFRQFVAGGRAAPAADEEHFRLLTGFNDIFVAIAAVILLVAVGWIGGSVQPAVGSFAVAAASWGLAEYFTRERRMALPSIVLLLGFVGGVFAGFATLVSGSDGALQSGNGGEELLAALAAAIAAGAAWLHWRRFRVPITVAAGVGALVGFAIALLAAAVDDQQVLLIASLVGGIAVFATAMWWDGSDPERRTRRSDVAFWLHLLAAPMIVHPIFALLGLTEGSATTGEAVIVLLVYLGLGATAVAIDRRALLVSALAYVLWALSDLFERFGAVELNFALTALIIGSALLLLSAFWQGARRMLVAPLPAALRARLPVVSPRPAS